MAHILAPKAFMRYIGSGRCEMQRFYDTNMKIVGYILSGAANRQTAYDSDFQALGYYYPHSDKTYDKNMTLIGRGNQLASFFGNAAQEEA